MYESIEKEEYKGLNSQPGIYVILNVLDCRIYVGQAKNFNNRSHLDELEKGIDNSQLQKDYNDVNKELLYFILFCNAENDKKERNKLERIYMLLFEELGFELYNTNRPSKERKSEFSDEELTILKNEINEDFKLRFNCDALGLLNGNREEAWNYYLKIRNNKKYEFNELLKSDRLIFNKKYICKIFDNEIITPNNLDVSDFFFSKAGNYVGDGFDQIISYEKESIKNKGFALWTFSTNAVKVDLVRNACYERAKGKKEVYVIFSYTVSATYAVGEAYWHTRVSDEDVKCAEVVKALEELGFDKKEKGYYVPMGIDCTAGGKKSVNAFVIDKFMMLSKNVNEEYLKNNYHTLITNESNKKIGKDFSRSTHYYYNTNDNDNSLFEDTVGRKINFIGRLKAPYIVKLQNVGEDRSL